MSKTGTKKTDVTIVSSSVLGSCWGVTDRRVRQLRQEGIITAVSRGNYNLFECTKRYCKYLKQVKVKV